MINLSELAELGNTVLIDTCVLCQDYNHADGKDSHARNRLNQALRGATGLSELDTELLEVVYDHVARKIQVIALHPSIRTIKGVVGEYSKHRGYLQQKCDRLNIPATYRGSHPLEKIIALQGLAERILESRAVDHEASRTLANYIQENRLYRPGGADKEKKHKRKEITGEVDAYLVANAITHVKIDEEDTYILTTDGDIYNMVKNLSRALNSSGINLPADVVVVSPHTRDWTNELKIFPRASTSSLDKHKVRCRFKEKFARISTLSGSELADPSAQ